METTDYIDCRAPKMCHPNHCHSRNSCSKSHGCPSCCPCSAPTPHLQRWPSLACRCVPHYVCQICPTHVLGPVLSSITLQYSSKSSSITASSNSCGSIMTLLLAIYQWYSSSPSSSCRLFVVLVVLVVSVVVSAHLTSINLQS